MKPKHYFNLGLLGGLWGASFLFMRVASKEFGPIALIQVRVSVAAILLLMFLLFRGETKHLKKHAWQLFVLGAINSAIPFTLYAYAVLRLPAGLTSVLNATAPLFGTLIAYVWLKQPQSSRRIFGVVLGFLGVVILVSNKLGGSGDLWFIAAGLLAAFLYGIAANYSKHCLSGVPPLVVSAGSLVSASIMLIPLTIMQLPVAVPSSTSILCAIALGIACTGLAYLLFFQLIADIGVPKAMSVAYLIPLFGVLWGQLFLSEAITLQMIIGGVIVLAGVAIVNGVKS